MRGLGHGPRRSSNNSRSKSPGALKPAAAKAEVELAQAKQAGARG